MTRLLVCAVCAALAIGPAFAAGHDTQLESWIKEHVASNMGELRRGIDIDAKPELVTEETLKRANDAPGLGFPRYDPMSTGSLRH